MVKTISITFDYIIHTVYKLIRLTLYYLKPALRDAYNLLCVVNKTALKLRFITEHILLNFTLILPYTFEANY